MLAERLMSKSNEEENSESGVYLGIIVIVPLMVEQYDELCFVLFTSQVQVPQ